MSDLISRQAAIDAVDKYIDKFDCIDENFLDGLKTTKKFLNDLPSTEREQRWVPCSERLPEYGQAVLVALDGGSMTDGVRSSDHAGRSVWDCALDNRTWYDDENIVIAWMPLPEPWRGEEHETD